MSNASRRAMAADRASPTTYQPRLRRPAGLPEGQPAFRTSLPTNATELRDPAGVQHAAGLRARRTRDATNTMAVLSLVLAFLFRRPG